MLGRWIHVGLLEGGTIIQMMEHLAEQTQETIALGIQNGLQSQHVHIIQPSQPLSYRPVIGLMRPLLRSAVGKVILAHRSRESVLKIVERINTLGVDEVRIFDPNTVLAELAAVREAGFTYSANVFMEGVAIVAVALPAGDNSVPMALSVSGPSTRISEQAIPKLAAQIKDAIAQFK
jgi:DNA-binding IclR family transcriptional regulator